MITKRNLIESIQRRLANGDVPADLLSKYAYPDISLVLSLIYSDALTSSPARKGDLSYPYDCIREGDSNKGFYISLPAQPMLGSESILSLQGSGTYQYRVRMGFEENTLLQALKPQTTMITCYLSQGKLIFNRSAVPPEETITVNMIPNILTMDDDQYVCLPGKEGSIYDMVLQKIRQAENFPGELRNDGIPDRDKMQPQ